MTVNHRTGKIRYPIFETLEEAQAADVNIMPLETAMPGDYVLTDNGYYIPVLTRQEVYKKGSGKYRPYKTIFFKFPVMEWTCRMYIDTMKCKDKVFTFSFQPRRYNRFVVTKKLKAFVKLLKQDIDIYIAHNMIFGNDKKVHRKYSVMNLFANKDFIQYLIDEEVMESMKKQITDGKTTITEISKAMFKIFKDPKENASVRIRSMDAIWNALTAEEEKTVSDPLGRPTPEQVSDLIVTDDGIKS